MHVLDARRSFVRSVDIPMGMTMYLCYVEAYCSPVGFVWGYGEAEHGVFEVLGSYVEPWARRQGIRSVLNTAISADYRTIATAAGTSEGEAFMRAAGYKFNKTLHRFYKTKGGKA